MSCINIVHVDDVGIAFRIDPPHQHQRICPSSLQPNQHDLPPGTAKAAVATVIIITKITTSMVETQPPAPLVKTVPGAAGIEVRKELIFLPTRAQNLFSRGLMGLQDFFRGLISWICLENSSIIFASIFRIGRTGPCSAGLFEVSANDFSRSLL